MKFLFLVALLPLVYGKNICLPEKVSFVVIDLLHDTGAYNVSFDFSHKRMLAVGESGGAVVDFSTNTVYETDEQGNCESFLAYGGYVWEKCMPSEAVEIGQLYQGFNQEVTLTGYRFTEPGTTVSSLVYTAPQGSYPLLRRDVVGNFTTLYMFANPSTTIPSNDAFNIPSPCPPRV